ncbi:MAG: DNA repair protein RadC, partial [Proteobacteria bacterium]|nr:DNA repair protein RadC [Pseudomonadota bacterium]
MNKPHYHGHRQRLRERLTKDSTALADYELLELLLAQSLPRHDTKPLAKELLARFGSLRSVLYAPAAQLTEFKGFGPSTAAAWTLLRELWARIQEAPLSTKDIFSDPRAIADAARARFGTKGSEELWAAFLDNQNRAIAWERITSGSVGHAVASPRDIVSPALKHEAARVVLVHNHPGGSTWPSPEDKAFTQHMVRTASGVNV